LEWGRRRLLLLVVVVVVIADWLACWLERTSVDVHGSDAGFDYGHLHQQLPTQRCTRCSRVCVCMCVCIFFFDISSTFSFVHLLTSRCSIHPTVTLLHTHSRKHGLSLVAVQLKATKATKTHVT